MNKFTFALLLELASYFDEEKEYSGETKIEELFCETFDELSWVNCLVNLELIYGFEIPDELADQRHLSISDFCKNLAEIPFLHDKDYPEFYEIKKSLIQDNSRLLMIEIGSEEATPEEIKEIKERLNRNDKRREVLTKIKAN